ncbi:MAG: GTP 3',8-cyclase MoaA [Sandaracinaceae bacterium]
MLDTPTAMARRHLPIANAPQASRMARLAALPPVPEGFGDPEVPLLSDARGRVYSYLRLSLTDRCNLACVYCMPPGGETEHALRPELLTFEEALQVIEVFAAGGVRRVRFTGGEPLVRKDVVRLVEMVRRRTPIEDLVMTSNAVRLPELARPLAQAGLRGVNISIDSLDGDRFRAITRGGDLGPVLAGFHAALDAGLQVKLNIVALGGVNDDEVGALVDFAWDHGVVPRFIELMPLGEAALLPAERFLSADRILDLLGDRVERTVERHGETGKGPARHLPARRRDGRKVGFITAISDEFCGTCNRVRVTAKGDLRACLADRTAVSLRDLLRDGATDRDLAWAIHWALGGKDRGHHFLDDAVEEHTHVGKSLIGG